MKVTKPYWYHNTAYSMERYFVCLHFPNLNTALGIHTDHDSLGEGEVSIMA